MTSHVDHYATAGDEVCRRIEIDWTMMTTAGADRTGCPRRGDECPTLVASAHADQKNKNKIHGKMKIRI
jgi:hypothetical protein